jgi:hypothetical protein
MNKTHVQCGLFSKSGLRMAKADKKTSASKQKDKLTIAEQTAIFLKAGGKVEQIPSGVSGQVNMTGAKK